MPTSSQYRVVVSNELGSPGTEATCDGAGPDELGSLIASCGGAGCVFDRNTSNFQYCRTLGGAVGAACLSDKAFVCQLDNVSKVNDTYALLNCSTILCYDHRPSKKLTLLAALLAFAGLARAAECCGSTTSGGVDENTVWNLRADMCNNVWSHNTNQGNYEDWYSSTNGVGETRDLILEAYDSANAYPSCWDAYGNIIEQCYRNGYGVGVWSSGSEVYSMEFADKAFVKRDQPAPVPLDEQPTVKLGTSLFSHNGVTLNVTLASIEPAHSKRTDFSKTGFNTTVNLDDNEVLLDALRTIADAKAERKRGIACETESPLILGIVRGGYWWTKWQTMNQCILCPGTGSCTFAQASGRTTTISTTLGASGGYDVGIVKGTLNLGITAAQSWTSTTTLSCTWNDASCHQPAEATGMAWSEGYAIQTASSGTYSADVYAWYFHADMPAGYSALTCQYSCCGDGVCSQLDWSKEWCKYATDADRSVYGVCSNWDDTSCIDGSFWQYS